MKFKDIKTYGVIVLGGCKFIYDDYDIDKNNIYLYNGDDFESLQINRSGIIICREEMSSNEIFEEKIEGEFDFEKLKKMI